MEILGWLQRKMDGTQRTPAPAAHDPRSVIRLEEVEHTPKGLVLRGSTGLVPPKFHFSAEVLWINDEKRADKTPIATVDGTWTDEQGRFEALLECFGGPGFVFPTGRYIINFNARFDTVWQTASFANAVGVTTDPQGRADMFANPALLPESPELVPSGGGRRLDTNRIITVKRGLNRL